MKAGSSINQQIMNEPWVEAAGRFKPAQRATSCLEEGRNTRPRIICCRPHTRAHVILELLLSQGCADLPWALRCRPRTRARDLRNIGQPRAARTCPGLYAVARIRGLAIFTQDSL